MFILHSQLNISSNINWWLRNFSSCQCSVFVWASDFWMNNKDPTVAFINYVKLSAKSKYVQYCNMISLKALYVWVCYFCMRLQFSTLPLHYILCSLIKQPGDAVMLNMVEWGSNHTFPNENGILTVEGWCSHHRLTYKGPIQILFQCYLQFIPAFNNLIWLDLVKYSCS